MQRHYTIIRRIRGKGVDFKVIRDNERTRGLPNDFQIIGGLWAKNLEEAHKMLVEAVIHPVNKLASY